MPGSRLGTFELFGGIPQGIAFNHTTNGPMVGTVNFVNRNNVTVNVSIAISTNATAPGNDEWITWNTPVAPGDSFERPDIIIAQAQYIVVKSSLGSVSASCWGVWADTTITGSQDVALNSYYDGSTSAKAAPSALYIKKITGTTSDGVYWIKASEAATAQQIYCVMDNSWDGGGWMILANNAATDIVYQSSHIPRLTARAAYVGTNGANSYTSTNNFSINAKDIGINQWAWCAWSTTFKNITTYTYGTMNRTKYVPDTTNYLRTLDNFHQTLPWLAGSDIRVRPAVAIDPTGDKALAFSCFGIDTGIINGSDYTVNMSYVNVMILGRQGTIVGYNAFDNDVDMNGMNGNFSWADRMTSGAEATNSIRGWDDFQNGNSLGDGWGSATVANLSRGSASYIMVK
jgi:hypothetical protein